MLNYIRNIDAFDQVKITFASITISVKSNYTNRQKGVIQYQKTFVHYWAGRFFY